MGVGTILIERGLIDSEQLDRAIEEQNRTGERLDHVLVRLGLVSSAAVLEVIGQQFALPIVDLDSIDVAPDVQGLGSLVFPRVDELMEVARSADRQGLLNPPLLTSNRVREIAGASTGESHGVLERYAARQDEVMLSGWAILPDRGEPAHAVLLCHEIPGEEKDRIQAIRERLDMEESGVLALASEEGRR